MALKTIVSDTGPLISLEKIRDGYRFIRKLYDKIIVPSVVLGELAVFYSESARYLEKFDIVDLMEVCDDYRIQDIPGVEKLDPGEARAISLAAKLKSRLLIEERDGRKIAQKAGLEISGIAGRILFARKMNIIETVDARNKLRDLYENHRINLSLFNELSKRV